MIESIYRFPSKLQPLRLADRKRLEQTQIEVVRPPCLKRVATHGGRVRKRSQRRLHPAHLGWFDAHPRVRVQIAGCAAPIPDSTAGHRRVRIPNVRTVRPRQAIVVSIEAILNGEWRS